MHHFRWLAAAGHRSSADEAPITVTRSLDVRRAPSLSMHNGRLNRPEGLSVVRKSAPESEIIEVP